jgi:hypothetical protein
MRRGFGVEMRDDPGDDRIGDSLQPNRTGLIHAPRLEAQELDQDEVSEAVESRLGADLGVGRDLFFHHPHQLGDAGAAP